MSRFTPVLRVSSAVLLIVEAVYVAIGGFLLFSAARGLAGYQNAAYEQERLRGVLLGTVIALVVLWALVAATALILGCRREFLAGFCQVLIGLLAIGHLGVGLFWLVNGVYTPALIAVSLGLLILAAIWNTESTSPTPVMF